MEYAESVEPEALVQCGSTSMCVCSLCALRHLSSSPSNLLSLSSRECSLLTSCLASSSKLTSSKAVPSTTRIWMKTKTNKSLIEINAGCDQFYWNLEVVIELEQQSVVSIIDSMEGTFQVIKDDPYLEAFQGSFKQLHDLYHNTLATYDSNQGGILNFSHSYHRFGINRDGDHMVYREWAPMAQEVAFYGDFNNWNAEEFKATKGAFGIWEVRMKVNIPQSTLVKAKVKLEDGTYVDRVPAWIKLARQNEYTTFDGVFYESSYKFNHQCPQWDNSNIKIYECHVGMSGTEPRIYSYKHFRENVVDRIVDLGYNVIQLMAIAEHPYYGCFGYHVSSFFAPSTKFGTPDQLKQLIDYAHSRNLKVLIDLVHAHAVKNIGEGLNMWDGTDYHYFHAYPQGYHSQWDSRIFDYSKYEVQRFLLSNIRYWMEEFRVDGYRLDGVTSMIYKHHGINYGFTGNYQEYFNENLDKDALVYLMLVSTVMKSLNPKSILIGEDVSGFPGLCRPISEGGFGVDFRLNMSVPDLWIRFVKDVRDEDWNMDELVNALANRRYKEKVIGYSESHDQAFVGDKTIAQWLFDQEIYSEMSIHKPQTITVFRAMALHKMIRLTTLSLGGEGYLAFMGNEFGHPEWIDFPRDGNNWSYEFCRRKWNLLDDKDLRFHQLNNFDKAMLHLEYETKFLSATNAFISVQNNTDKVIVHEKNDLLFVFNFHPTQSYENYQVPCEFNGLMIIVLDTDRADFGGHSRVEQRDYQTQPIPLSNRQNSFKIYLPSRSGVVFRLKH